MILKSFLRKKTIVIYSIIIISLITAVLTLNSFITELNKIKNDIYTENSLIVVKSKTDYYEKYKKNRHVERVYKALLFDPNYDDEEQILKSDKDYIRQENLSWYSVRNDDLNGKVLVISDKDKDFKLASDEVALGIDEYAWESEEIGDDNSFNGERTSFKYNDKIVDLKVGLIYSVPMNSEVTISDSLFNELSKESKEFTTVIVPKSEKESSKIFDKLQEDEDNYVHRASGTDTQDDIIISKTNSSIYSLEIANYVIIVILLVMFLIINKNIVEDLKDNLSLERKLGFNLRKIKLNVFKRLCILHLINIVLSIIISSIILSVIKTNVSNTLASISITYLIYLSVIIFLYDVFISLTVKVK